MLNAVGAIGGPTEGGYGPDELFVTSASATNPTVTLAVTTQSGGIALGANSSLTVVKAVAGGGPIDLEAPQSGTTFTVAGPVTTSDDGIAGSGGGINLVAYSLDINSGLVSSDDGAITITPTFTLDIAPLATVRTSQTTGLAGTITIAPPTLPVAMQLLDIAGTVAASGAVSITGAGSDTSSPLPITTTLIVSGNLSSGSDLTIGANGQGSAETAVFDLGGTITTVGDATIAATSPATYNLSGTFRIGGATTIGNNATINPVSITVTGPIISTAAVTLNGTTTGDSVITIAAPITSETSIAVVGNGATATDTLELTTTTLGALTAPTVTLTGSYGNDTFVLAGPITASASGGIAIDGARP